MKQVDNSLRFFSFILTICCVQNQYAKSDYNINLFSHKFKRH